MKAKGFFAMAMFSIISIGGIAQGFNNDSGSGFTGYTSSGFRNNYEPGRSQTHEKERKFNFAFIPSSDNGGYETESEGIINKMTCTDEITADQVELIFDIAREFPENTEISIALINDGRVLFYGLKRQNNAIINIENHSSCEYTSAVAIDINNESGVLILSNVSGLCKKKGKFNALCFDLLATLSNDK